MNVDAMIKHRQAVAEVITHAMSDYASAATGTSWNKACFAFEADAILCALSRAGFRILGPDEVDPVTVERCVGVAAATDPEKPANWLHRREEIAAAIRALSSPDHADAGKVEGDGWRPIESAPKAIRDLEAKLAAAQEAHKSLFGDKTMEDILWPDVKPTDLITIRVQKQIYDKARAVLGGKPSC